MCLRQSEKGVGKKATRLMERPDGQRVDQGLAQPGVRMESVKAIAVDFWEGMAGT